MFPTKKELSTIKCPKGIHCVLGAPSCPFSHTNVESDVLPPIGYFGVRKKEFGQAIEEAKPKRTKENQGKDTSIDLERKRQTCPRLPLEQHSRVPWRIRQASLEKIFVELKDGSRALSTEKELYLKSPTKQAYSNNYASLILKLRQQCRIESTDEVSTKATPIDRLRGAIHNRQVLSENGYLFTSDEVQRAMEARGMRDNSYLCDRCKTRFLPSDYYGQALEGRQQCYYHFGSKVKTNGQRLHSCCHKAVGEPGCTTAPSHVFSTIPPIEEFKEISRWPRSAHQRPVVALDVEMIYTTEGQFPARVSMVDWHGNPILDVLVRPSAPIVDFNTRYSGISAKDLQANHSEILINYSDLRKRVGELIGPDTILIGHSLENDMLALKLISDQIIDTAILFPHPLRQEAKQSLKVLAIKYLKEFIQEGSDGHCSVQDALTCLKLVKEKLSFS